MEKEKEQEKLENEEIEEVIEVLNPSLSQKKIKNQSLIESTKTIEQNENKENGQI